MSLYAREVASIECRVHFVVDWGAIVIRNYISADSDDRYQYITASSASVSTCQLTKPNTFSRFNSCKTTNRVAGSRISAFFDFGDQPTDEVAYLASAVPRVCDTCA